MKAAQKGPNNLVSLLITKGAHPQDTNDFGETALSLGEKGGYKETAHLLRGASQANESKESSAQQGNEHGVLS